MLVQPFLLKRMAEILEVDTAYLLGEIDCKKNSLETVCKYTGLTENSASLISSHREICISLNRLFSTIYYEELFSLITDTNILYKKIAHMLDKIQELNHHEFILAYSPDKIISNRRFLLSLCLHIP